VSQDVLEEWATLQRKWMSLEPIFTAPDIARQLPMETKTFSTVDTSWKEMMRRTRDDPNAIRVSSRPGLKDALIRHNSTLDAVQRGLDQYLEAKRAAFPRFYFISSDELIQLVSRSKDHTVVQPHLRKCFDNIAQLKFGEPPASGVGGVPIEGMISAEGEVVAFAKAMKTRGQIEEWLTAVEDNMKTTLQVQSLAACVCVHAPFRGFTCSLCAETCESRIGGLRRAA
jgi:dynein heavy chain, axonemal